MQSPTPTEDRDTHLAFALHTAAFLSGFVTMALEMLIGRTLMPYFGGTIYTWGALISVFLTGMTFGYVVGGKAADRRPDTLVIGALFILGALSIMIVPLFGESAVNAIMDNVDDVRYAALLASLALACLPAALFAAVCPYCVRLLLDRRDHSGTISGRMSGLATAGSIVGTLGTSFFFIPSLGVKMIYGLLGGVSVLIGCIFLVLGARQRGSVTTARHSLPLLLVFAVALAGVSAPTPGFAQATSTLMLRDGVIEKVESEYNTIFVEKQGSMITLNFGYRSNRYTESVLDTRNLNDLVVTYTRYMTAALAYRQEPVKRIALVGLGGGRTISYLVASMPDVVADVAELDPAVIMLARKYFAMEGSNRLRVHSKDGRVFLTQSKDKFDLILLDAYRGPFVPFHLTTQEFYRLVKNRLSPGGVVAQNVEPSTMFFDAAYVTMKSVFEQVDVIDAGGNIVLVGYVGPRLSTAELESRARKMQEKLKLKYDLRELIMARRDAQISKEAKVLTDDFAPVEMLKTVKHHNEKRQ